jgi:hypothetical protein
MKVPSKEARTLELKELGTITIEGLQPEKGQLV